MDILNTHDIREAMERGEEVDESISDLIIWTLRSRETLEIGRSYLFKERDKYNYFEGKVICFGVRDMDTDGGDERFMLVKLLVDGKKVWWIRDSIKKQEQFPSDYEDGY
jgi:hypothetical protein